MPRVMSQVSVFLRQDDAVTEEIKISNVQVSNIPRNSYLVDRLDADNTKQDLFNGSEMTISASEGDKEYNGKLYHTYQTAYPLRTRYCSVKEMLISDSSVIPIIMSMRPLNR